MRKSTILLCLVLASCGGSSASSGKSSDGDPARTGRDVRVENGRIVSLSVASPDDVRRDEGLAADFSLEARVPDVVYTPGRSFPVRLVLKNVGPTPWRMYQPERSLAEDLRVRAVRPDGTKGVIESQLPVAEGDVTEGDLVLLAPGVTVGARVDLGPMLQTLTWGQPGPYRLEIAFVGGHQGSRFGMDVWNRTRTRQVVAPAFTVRAAEAVGVGPRTREVTRHLLDVGPNGRLSAAARREIAATGAAALPVLAASLHLVESPERRDQAAGWGAFEILFETGPAALAELVPIRPARPIHEYLVALLEQRRAEEKGTGPAGIVATDLFDSSRAAEVLYRLTRHGIDRQSEVTTVHGDGIVETETHRAGRVSTLRGALDATGLYVFRDALVRGRFGLQRGIRKAGMKDEALLVFEELRFEPVAGVTVEKSLRRFEVWEEEAFLNVPLYGVVRAFQAARTVAR